MSTSAATPTKTIRTGRRAKGTHAPPSSPSGSWPAIAIPIWTHFDKPAWDYKIYLCAVESLKAGHDPYADAIAVQKQFHATLAQHTQRAGPLQLCLLSADAAAGAPVRCLSAVTRRHRILAVVPVRRAGAGVGGAVGARGQRAAQHFCWSAPRSRLLPRHAVERHHPERQRRHDPVRSGPAGRAAWMAARQVALVLHRGRSGLVLQGSAAQLAGDPVALRPRKMARSRAGGRRWGDPGSTVQPMLYPSLFRHFIEAVELQFSFNQDFGVSPAGLFSGWLMQAWAPIRSGQLSLLSRPTPCRLFATLLYLSRQYLAGRFDLKQWVPVMLCWRHPAQPAADRVRPAAHGDPCRAGLSGASSRCSAPASASPHSWSSFAVINAIALQSWPIWKLTAGTFAGRMFLSRGLYTLLRHKVAGAWLARLEFAADTTADSLRE